MRRGVALIWVFVCASCAAKSASAPPTSPTAPTAISSAPPARWYCFADTEGAGTDCLRTYAECTDAANEWANDDQDGDGVGDNQSTPCTAQASAYCYSYVPDDSTSGQSLTLCQTTMESCNSSAGVAGAKPGTMTACTETE